MQGCGLFLNCSINYNFMETALKRPAKLQRLGREFQPPIVRIIRKYKADKRAGTPTKLKRDLGVLGLQTLTALAINRATAQFIGVGAWDPKLQHGANRMVSDASPVSLTVSTWIASSIPAHYAHPVQAAEYVMCVIRICTEQWAWKKTGITGDPAGPILSPFLAGTLEMALKCVEKQPADEPTRLLVAANGIFGNLVRMAEAGLLVLAHWAYKKWGRPQEREDAARQPGK
jgi:hypothetical protein